jgi:hypothetical protein
VGKINITIGNREIERNRRERRLFERRLTGWERERKREN